MKTINEYKKRFDQLLESTIGNAKPLISEDENFEQFQINLKEITPEELKKFMASLESIKDAACSKGEKNCIKCTEMFENLRNGMVKNKLIETCFDCKFAVDPKGKDAYNQCVRLKSEFKRILIQIQEELKSGKKEGRLGSIVQTAGDVSMILNMLQGLLRPIKELFSKQPTQNP